jgi:hypothetical protein
MIVFQNAEFFEDFAYYGDPAGEEGGNRLSSRSMSS